MRNSGTLFWKIDGPLGLKRWRCQAHRVNGLVRCWSMSRTRKRERSRAMRSSDTRKAAARKTATARKRRATGKKAAVRGTPSVIPMISYEDGVAALEWLGKTFGFRETARFTAPDGKLSHGEMEAG